MDRTPLNDLILQGSPNVKRALKRQERDAAKKLTPDNKKRLAAIDRLIDATISECDEGSAVGPLSKRNPAFSNLESLMRTRKMLLRETPPEVEQSVDDLLAEASKIGKTN